MFPTDKYPYTNFHELNLGYFIIHFREIFSQWADLYDQMLRWKDATDEELATWEAGVEADLDQREAALRAELETWKAQTGQDIAGWEDATLAALTAWQTATQAVFEAIRVDAAGSATAAAASATVAAAAKTAAETAQAAAEAAALSVQASAAQIADNTSDIDQIKNDLYGKPQHLTLELGAVRASDGYKYASVSRMRTIRPIFLESGDVFSVDHTIKYNCFRSTADGTYVETIAGSFSYNDLTISSDGYYMFGLELTSDTSADLTGRESEFEAYTLITYAEPDAGIAERLETLETAVNGQSGDILDIENEITEINDILGSTRPQHLTLELGAIRASDGYKYNSVSRMRSVLPVYLESGDVFSVDHTIKYNCFRSTADGTYVETIASSYSYNNLTVTTPGYYMFGIQLTADPDADLTGRESEFEAYTLITYANPDTGMVAQVAENTSDIEELKSKIFQNQLTFAGEMNAETVYSFGSRYCTDDYILSFNIHFASFTSFTIGELNSSLTAISGGYLEVDDTNLTLVSATGPDWNRQEAHGLTIANDLQIIITKKKNDLSYGITIRSSGQEYVATGNWRLGVYYYGYGFTSGADAEVHAAYAITDIYKPVWVCGDSWVTYFSSRWYYYAVENGHANFLKSGHSGEKSADGLIQLQTLLDINKPKCLLWLYGMNDSDSNDSTPNSDWKTAFDTIVSICNDKHIELIVATIPTTPTRNNNAKNAVVRNSGLRYVDEVMAMGANTSGTWISGYQSDDGNHTSVAGAKALYAQVLADAPEIALT